MSSIDIHSPESVARSRVHAVSIRNLVDRGVLDESHRASADEIDAYATERENKHIASAEPEHEPGAVSLVVARAVLHYFGDTNLGIEAGNFTTRLIRTIVSADQGNRDKLATVYPEHVAAVHAVQQETWGLDWLQTIARKDVA